jgi:hypothetical protein
VIPFGFHLSGDWIAACTAVTAPEVKVLSSRPNVAVTIDVGDTRTEAKSLRVRALAHVEIDFGAGRMPAFLTKLASDAS